jgi:branched-chain amino acid transport system ATP-binding protein
MPTCPGMSASRKPIWGQVMPDLKMADAATTKSAQTSGAANPVLSVQNLEAWYGESHILHGINFNVNAGEVVTLLGRNGAGKTTTLKSVMGIIGKRTGSIRFNDQEIIRTTSDRIARMGVAFCPEERGIFASLDVRENLLLPPIVRAGGLSLDQIFDLFPNLKERLNSQGTKLSGGEQQMLAIARILRTGARFLMLDEPTEGLAPVIIQQIGHTIARLKKEGFTILLVEQNFRFAATVADRYYIVEHGKIIDGFANSELQANMDKLHTYLGV